VAVVAPGVGALAAAALAALAAIVPAVAAAPAPPPPAISASVAIGGPDPVAPIPNGFLGLSIEYQSIAAIAGPPTDQNTVFDQLVRNLAPSQQPVLRIGGDSTDHAWVPEPGLPGSPSLFWWLTPQWMSRVAALTSTLNAQLILGINLEIDRPRIAGTEAQAMLNAFGADHIAAFEIGNEPDLYAALTWYTAGGGRQVLGRPPSYGFYDYAQELERSASVLPPLSLAGPALGQTEWMPALGWLLDMFPAMQIVTYHLYPLNRCFTSPGMSTYPTISNLLSTASTDNLAAVIEPFAATAHAAGRKFRVDELNSVACAGQLGVSNTFASALWVLDTLFALVRDGADGVNVHTFQGAAYSLFSFANAHGRWSGTVNPEYYGMLAFAQAAPPGARLLRVVARENRQLRVWATRTPAGDTNVVLINDDPAQAVNAMVRAPSAVATAQVELLRAPSVAATAGVTLGGAAFASPTTTGELARTPQPERVSPTNGAYAVTVPAASAALLTVPPAGTATDQLAGLPR
jgi:hypothetical protein